MVFMKLEFWQFSSDTITHFHISRCVDKKMAHTKDTSFQTPRRPFKGHRHKATLDNVATPNSFPLTKHLIMSVCVFCSSSSSSISMQSLTPEMIARHKPACVFLICMHILVLLKGAGGGSLICQPPPQRLL